MKWLVMIGYRSRGVLFEVGFCYEWTDDGNGVLLRAPFVKSTVHTPLGAIHCRGIWGRPYRLSKKQYEITFCKEEPWMELHVVDVLWAEQLCVECSIDLPEDGYRRI